MFFLFFVCEMRTTKQHENNLSKIADTSTNYQNIPEAVTMYHDH